jgi:hypothetical protein
MSGFSKALEQHPSLQWIVGIAGLILGLLLPIGHIA